MSPQVLRENFDFSVVEKPYTKILEYVNEDWRQEVPLDQTVVERMRKL